MEKEFNDMRDIFKVLPTTQEEKDYMIVILSYRDWETFSNNRKISNA